MVFVGLCLILLTVTARAQLEAKF